MYGCDDVGWIKFAFLFLSRVSPDYLADELHRAKDGAKDPGLHPGDPTADYLADGLLVFVITIITINQHPSSASIVTLTHHLAGMPFRN